MAYVNPGWTDNSAPNISAANLDDLSDTVVASQVLSGTSSPSTSTAGAVGQFYLVTVADANGVYPLFQCVDDTGGTYTWVKRNCNVLTNTYTGTGNHGAGNPTTISIGMTQPFLVVVSTTTSDSSTATFAFPTATDAKTVGVYSNVNTPQMLTYSFSGGTFSFYNAINDRYQFNSSGVTYRWVAIGA